MSAPFRLPYRLAPDTPAEIAADLARLCAEAEVPASAPAARAQGTASSASIVNGLGPKSEAESTGPTSASPAARRRARFGSLPFVEIVDRLTGGRI